MRSALQISKNDFPERTELGAYGWLTQDTRLSRNIRSFHSTAKSVVSKVNGLGKGKLKLILVIDNDPVTFRWIAGFLEEDLACKILTATTGETALGVARSVVPDLIIADWPNAEIDVPDLIKQLKSSSLTRDIPVLMATGVMAPIKEFEKVLHSGVAEYMRKQLDEMDFKARMKAALALDESLKAIQREKESIELRNQFVDFLLDAAPNPVFYQDIEGRFLGCNKSFERLVSKSRVEIIGKPANKFLPRAVAKVFDAQFSALMKSARIRKFEIDIPTREEGRKHVVLSYVGLGTSCKEVVVGSITDITDIMQSGNETLIRFEKLHQKDKLKLASDNEELRAELDFKHRELAMNLDLLIHSRNVKEKLIEGVNKLQPYLAVEGKSKLFTVLRQLQRELDDAASLDIERKFDELNAGLYAALEKDCPEITKDEKRLCAYLKMNHGTADIAKITDKSVNSVKAGITRLKAKLGLSHMNDLRMYLNGLSVSTA